MRGLDRVLPDHAAFLAAHSRARRCDPGQVTPGAVVATVGRAEPGPAGVLTAPVSGQPCVWFRVLDIAEPPMTDIRPLLPPVVSSDMGIGAIEARAGNSTRDDESPAPFRIAGLTGAVLVEPALIDLDAQVISAHLEGGTYWRGWRVTREWILPPGAEVFACGEAIAGPHGTALRARPELPLVVTTRGEAVAVQRAHTVAARGVGPAMDTSRAARAIALAVGGVVAVAVLALLIVLLVR